MIVFDGIIDYNKEVLMKKLLTLFLCLSMLGSLVLAETKSKSTSVINKESSQSNLREDIIKEIIEKTFIDNDISKSLEELKKDQPESETTEVQDNFVFYQTGKASFYGERWNGRKTSNGEVFNTSLLTAAHKTLPFGTLVKVTNEANGKTVIVRINDRGPFIKGRVIDLSKAAFSAIESINKGVTKVKLEIIK